MDRIFSFGSRIDLFMFSAPADTIITVAAAETRRSSRDFSSRLLRDSFARGGPGRCKEIVNSYPFEIQERGFFASLADESLGNAISHASAFDSQLVWLAFLPGFNTNASISELDE